jgi:hypothetical protein
MTSEYAIPALKHTSTNFPFWEASLRRHLDGVGESRIIQSNYRLPTKDIVTTTLNPFWTDPDVATQSSSQTPATSTPSDPSGLPPTGLPSPTVQQWILTTTTVTNEIVSTYSPGLDRAGGAKVIPYQILNNQMISMFSRLLDKSHHHLLIYSRTINPLGAAATVFKAIKAHFSCSAWMTKMPSSEGGRTPGSAKIQRPHTTDSWS